jgi:hypothetical protein
MDFKCGTSTADACTGLDYDWNEDAAYKKLVNQAVDMANVGIKVAAGLMGA